ncbi:hypothetical protein [Thalassobacillus devorans]|uniref:hypothetical protein n=1 Tax=Thalassobacillus devorans TaxID=279813 RepID=UPI00141B1D4E|nr:hypothetical protein [Thalassobacillus devorans]
MYNSERVVSFLCSILRLLVGKRQEAFFYARSFPLPVPVSTTDTGGIEYENDKW